MCLDVHFECVFFLLRFVHIYAFRYSLYQFKCFSSTCWKSWMVQNGFLLHNEKVQRKKLFWKWTWNFMSHTRINCFTVLTYLVLLNTVWRQRQKLMITSKQDNHGSVCHTCCVYHLRPVFTSCTILFQRYFQITWFKLDVL